MGLILCVCTGNLCRSPMAAGLLAQKLAEMEPAGQYLVASAGVWAPDGSPASRNAVVVMAERGIDITDHISHAITVDDVARAELILVMSQEHGQVIQSTWPQYGWKVRRLSEMAGKREDVWDPFGGPIEAYRLCADTISRYIDEGLPRILELA